MEKNIIKLFIEKGFLLDKDTLNFFKELGDENIAREIVSKLSVISKQKVITKNFIKNNVKEFEPIFEILEGDKRKIVDKFLVNISVQVEVKHEREIKEVNNSEKNNSNYFVKVLDSPFIASKKVEVKDFIKNFRSRYNFFKNLLQEKKELEGLTSIDKIGNKRDFSIIGMISEKRVTKNKNIIFEVEDLTGRIRVLVNQNKEDVFEKAKEIVNDDVVGFKCSGDRNFIFANDLFLADIQNPKKKSCKEEIYALFISDIHLGSKNFLRKNFEKFLKWIQGKEIKNEFFDKIKYLFIVGDSIDGVGIYPGQEKDLEIKDLKEQYKELASYLKQIPNHIQIIQCAGQHDGVRVAEPQPPIGEDFGAPLHEIKNLHLVSNPSLVEIGCGENEEGFKVLMYHGASMHGIINEIEELRVNNAHHNPSMAVKHLLKKRHLNSIHGNGIYIPNSDEDSMIIKQVPDIITTGDLHRTDIDNYNGIKIICNSCWQSITAFEEKVGNIPDPCKVPILNLKTREVKILDFSDE